MNTYELIVTKTGGMWLQADSREEAVAALNKMSNQEIEEAVCMGDWKCTDLQNVKLLEYYYQITLPQQDQIFFRATENTYEPQNIFAIAVDKGLVSKDTSYKEAVQHDSETYQKNILDYLYIKMCREREEFRKWMEIQPPEYIYEHCGDIQFYEDIIWLFEDFAEDEEFNLEAVEKLIKVDKPIEALSSSYVDIDFSSLNNQLMELINNAAKH